MAPFLLIASIPSECYKIKTIYFSKKIALHFPYLKKLFHL
jgi:hypothetical protein